MTPERGHISRCWIVARPSAGIPALGVALACVAGACVGAAAEHEKLGDRAYVDGRFADALVEYRLALVQAAPSPMLRSKAAAAALEAEELTAAAEEYVALAEEGGGERETEAADGLVRVVREAIAAGDREALGAAVEGLQTIAPTRALGTFADELVRTLGTMPRSTDAMTALTYAAAGAPDARLQDSLMFAYGRTLRRVGRCREALPVLESLVRREREPAVVDAARRYVAQCALRLGRQALDRGQPQAAEDWFERAATGGGESDEARMAYVGLGDARFALGDFQGAQEAYLRAIGDGAVVDSIARIAADRLNDIGRVETPIP